MGLRQTLQKAKQALREGTALTTAAGEFAHDDVRHIRQGKRLPRASQRGSRIARKARRSGVRSAPPARGTAKRTRRSAQRGPSIRRPARGRGRSSRQARTRAPAARGRRWSRHVMETSDALDLEKGVFRQHSPRQVALSLKRSAERSQRRKAEPFLSAMSMLNFYLNRAGKTLNAERKRTLNQAKEELRNLFERSGPIRRRSSGSGGRARRS